MRMPLVDLKPSMLGEGVTSTPEETGMSSSALDRIEGLLSGWVSSGVLPMVSVPHNRDRHTQTHNNILQDIQYIHTSTHKHTDCAPDVRYISAKLLL